MTNEEKICRTLCEMDDVDPDEPLYEGSERLVWMVYKEDAGRLLASIGCEVTVFERNCQDQFIWVVGSFLDHPSLYMGGPSSRSRFKAKGLWTALHKEGFVIDRLKGVED